MLPPARQKPPVADPAALAPTRPRQPAAWVDDGHGRPYVAVAADVVVGLLRGHRASEAAIETAVYGFGRTPAVSVLTRFELQRGPRDNHGRERLEALLAAWPVWPFEGEDADLAVAAAQACGCAAVELDLLLAGTATRRQAPLLTFAPGAYRGIPGVRVWDASAPPAM